MTRRAFLRHGLEGFLGLAAASRLGYLPELLAQDTMQRRPGRARSVILLWMSGGPSQLDTWDPKPGRETGGPTRAIETSVRGIQIASTLPRMARWMDRVALIRSMKTHEVEHARGTYLMHTGYAPNPTIRHPAMGAVVAMEASRESELPDFVSINGGTVDEGFLDARYAPLTIGDPEGGVPNLRPPDAVDPDRETARRDLLAAVESSFLPSRPYGIARKRVSVYISAVRMMDSPLTRAFRLDEEPADVRDAYGRNPFGQGCLLARRLAEAGVRCIEVHQGGWDTHRDNFTSVENLNAVVDQGFAALLNDLARRSLLDTTLIVWMGEFGRTPRINPNNGRDHFAEAWSVVLAGGGVPGGRVIGRTNEDGTDVAERPVSPAELTATIYSLMGIDPSRTVYTPEGRPMRYSEAQPIRELLW